MNEPNDKQDRLEELTKALANQPVPAGPDSAIEQQLLESLIEASELQTTTQPFHFWKGKTMRRIASIAAILLIVLGFATYLLPTNSGSPGGAYAAMLEQLQDIKTMSFTTRVVLPGPMEMTTRTLVLNQHQVREEILDKIDESEKPGDSAARTIRIFSLQAGKTLTLRTKEKTAKITDLGEMNAQGPQIDIIEKFRDMRQEEAEYLGEEVLNDKKTLKFRYSKPDGHYVVWLDSNDQLPVKVLIGDVAESNVVGAKFEMTEFVWNPEFDESLFSLEIPEGYDLEQEAKARTLADFERRGQEGLIGMLDFYVRLNENRFPGEFNLLVFSSVMKKLTKSGATPEEQKEYYLQKLAEALDRPEVLKMNDEELKVLSQQRAKEGSVGGAYLHSLLESQRWNYQGNDVKLGEANKIVAWWRPLEDKAEEGDHAGTAHVLYGDLRIETMPVDELPKREKQ